MTMGLKVGGHRGNELWPDVSACVDVTGGTQPSRSVTLAALINIFAATGLVYLHIKAMDKKRIGLNYNLSFTVSSVVAIVTGAGQMVLNLLLSSGRGTSELYYSSTGLYCLLQVVYSTTTFWSIVVVPATWIGELLCHLRLLEWNPTQWSRLATLFAI